MNKFTFSNEFSGKTFYQKYNRAEFLKDSRNIRTILSKGYEILERLKELYPGEMLTIKGMFIQPDIPLVIKKSALNDESDIDCEEFTYRRLSGLVAAVAYERFVRCICYAFEAEDLGLEWETANTFRRCYYLSAASGAEYFSDFFGSYPLVWALQKYQMKKISAELLLTISKVQCENKVPMVVRLRKDFMYDENKIIQGNFNLRTAIKAAPEGIKRHFKHLPKMTS